MANKNLIRRMRQLLTLVLVLAMTMSFATMTAMAGNDKAAIKVGKDFNKDEDVTLYLDRPETEDVVESIQTETEGSGTAYLKFEMPEFYSNGISEGTEVPFTTSTGRAGIIVVGPHEGNDTSDDGQDTPDKGKNNYEGTVYFNVNVNVSKSWSGDEGLEGVRPTSVTVNLLANGSSTNQSVVLDETNNWEGSFTNLVKYKNEKEISYTVEEVSVDGYTSRISGSESNGYVITNSYKSPTTGALKISKEVVNSIEKSIEDTTDFTFTVVTGDMKPVILSSSETAPGEPSNKYIFVGVDEIGDGTALKLQSGDEIEINGLPTGDYYVKETPVDGYTLLTIDGEKPEGQYKKCQVTSDQIASAAFVNQKADSVQEDKTGTLKIKKKVLDTDGVYTTDDNTLFTFTVETAGEEELVLEKSATANDEYQFVKAEEKDKDGTKLQLKSGDEITIKGLPAGNYNVKEDRAEGYTLRTIDGEKVEGQSKQYTVKSQETTYSLFVNEKANSVQEDMTGMLQIKKRVVDTTGEAVNGDSTEFTFSVETADNKPVVLIETQGAADEYNFVKVGETGSEATALKLKSGDEIRINGLPAGNYNVKEDRAEGYTLRTIDDKKVEGQSKQYEVKSQETTKSIFVNEKANSVQEDMSGTLKIKKMVLDTDGDYTIDDNTIFTFTVETAGNAKKALVLEPSETRKDEYQFVEAVNEGGTELKLKSGDEITIKGLPAREYTVIEKQTDGYTLVEIDGVKVSNQTSKAYTLAEKGEERALFTNQQNKPDTEPPGENGNGNGGDNSGGGGLVTPPQKPLPPEQNLDIPETPVEPDTPEEPVEPSEKPLPDDKHVVTEVPKTGDVGADALMLNLLLLSISALAGTAFYLRRKTSGR